MAKYIIQWNAGFGPRDMIVEADSIEEADSMARAGAEWLEDADSNAEYSAEEYSEEKAEELGLD